MNINALNSAIIEIPTNGGMITLVDTVHESHEDQRIAVEIAVDELDESNPEHEELIEMFQAEGADHIVVSIRDGDLFDVDEASGSLDVSGYLIDSDDDSDESGEEWAEVITVSIPFSAVKCVKVLHWAD